MERFFQVYSIGRYLRTISLPVRVPVHILYWTAWVNEDGSLEFRDDIYGRDKRLTEAFAKTAPKAEKP